jgi:hypothetical protein
MNITVLKKVRKRYIGMCVGLVLSSPVMALPDVIDIYIEANQHKDRSPLCTGRGMSNKLSSTAGIRAIWYENKSLHWYAGYAKSYCMLNKGSLSDDMFSIGGGYRFFT